MDEVFWALLAVALAVTLVGVAIVGHALWLVAAFLFRLMSGSALRSNWRQQLRSIRSDLFDLHRRGIIPQRRFARVVGLLSDAEVRKDLAESKETLAADSSVVETPKPSAQPPVIAARVVHETEPAAPVLATLAPTYPRVSEKPTPATPSAAPAAIARAAHPLDRVEPPVAAAPRKREPARPVSVLLQAFMEEKNIRWGELVSGMLIVGSAIGLVISLWATLKHAIPYFPALLFMLVTAGIFGAGMYTLRRWKVRSTSRGLLIISLLLVPLNFLAAIALSPDRAMTAPLYLTAVAIGLVAFGGITALASRALDPKGWPLAVVAVLGTSITQIFMDRLATGGMALWQTTGLALLPVGCFLVATVGQLQIARLWPRLSAPRMGQMFLLLGLAAFAVPMPLVLLAWKTDAWRATLSELAPCYSLIAAGVLGLGGLVHRQVRGRRLAGWRLAGTSVALLAAVTMLAALAVAWPRPDLLIAVGVVNFVALSAIAVMSRFDGLHVPALASFALAALVGFQVYSGNIAGDATSGLQLFAALLRGYNSLVLILLSAVATAVAGWLARRGRRVRALSYMAAAVVLAIPGLLIALYAGFWSGVEAAVATPVIAAYAMGFLAGGTRVKHPAVAWIGAMLLAVASLHGLVFNDQLMGLLAQYRLAPRWPISAAMLLTATVCAALAGVWKRVLRATEVFRDAMSYSALLATALAAPVLVIVAAQFAARAAYATWVAAILLAVALVLERRDLFAAFKAMAMLATGFAVAAICQLQPWWGTSLLDPRHLQAQLIALAGWGIVWSGIRLLARARKWKHALLQPLAFSVDRVAVHGAAIGVVALAVLACMPGVTREFGIIMQSGAVSPVGLLDSLHEVQWGILLFLVASVVTVLSLHALGSFKALGFKPLVLTLATFVVLVSSHMGPVVEHVWQWIGVADAHVLAYGWGTWLALALVGAALVISLWERFSAAALANLVYLTSAVPFLLAAPFESQVAAASALRWGLALTAIAAATLICLRHRLVPVGRQMGWVGWEQASRPRVTESLRTVALLQTALPLLALTLGIVITVASGRALGGPAAASIFGQIHESLLYGGPLLLVALIMTAYAVRERSSIFALGASLMLSVAVSAGYLVPAWIAGAAGHAQVLATLVQANTVALGGATLLWLLVRRRLERAELVRLPLPGGPTPLEVQIGLMALGILFLTIWSFGVVFFEPELTLPLAAGHLGSPQGFVALIVAAIAAGAYVLFSARDEENQGRVARWSPHLLGIFSLGLATFVAASTAPWTTPNNWLAFHVLTAGCVAASALMTTVAWGRDRVAGLGWACVIGGLVVLLALRGGWSDPYMPWWSAGATLAVAGCAAALGLRFRSKVFTFASTVLAVLSSFFVGVQPWLRVWKTPAADGYLAVFWFAISAAAVMGSFWLLVEVYWQRRHKTSFYQQRNLLPAVDRFAGLLGVTGLTILVFFGVGIAAIVRQTGGDAVVIDWTTWTAVASLASLLVASSWDQRARYGLPGLYVLGVAATTAGLDYLRLDFESLLLGYACAMAGLVLLVGGGWTWRYSWVLLGKALRVPDVVARLQRTYAWLPVAQLVLAAQVALIGCWAVLSLEEQALRVAAAAAVAALVPGIAALAGTKDRLRYVSLILAALATVYVGWAVLPVAGESHFFLHRAVRMLVALAGATIAYGLFAIWIVPRESLWFGAVRRAAGTVCAVALVALVWTLAMEYVAYDKVLGSPVTAGETAQVAIVLAGLVASLLSMALLRGADPLGLSEKWRMAYVYAAEIVGALLFLHIYLTMPELFHGRLKPYWPFIVMAIATLGLAVGEVARRIKLPVLAEPLRRSGALLPLLPALGFWLMEPTITVDQRVVPTVSYHTTLFLVGLLYMVLAITRHRFVYACAAILAGNGALWALLHDQGFWLLEHPQFWLIPPALCVLVAAQLNRQRLGEAQLTAIRYCAAIVIYVSSTGEMFITGVGESLWPPIALATLSVVGVMVGIMLRVRAFLYLGSSFLMLSIISMVWHAAEQIERVWPWWAFGIVLGFTIMFAFGLLEKKRNELGGLLEDFRGWEK